MRIRRNRNTTGWADQSDQHRLHWRRCIVPGVGSYVRLCDECLNEMLFSSVRHASYRLEEIARNGQHFETELSLRVKGSWGSGQDDCVRRELRRF